MNKNTNLEGMKSEVLMGCVRRGLMGSLREC